MAHKVTGTVKWFDASKGYGYIEAGMGADVFVYHEEIIGNGFKYLLAGDQVEFLVKEKPRGPMALEVARTKR